MLTKKTLLNIAISALVIILGGASIKYLLFSAPKAQMQKPSSSGVMVETITLKPTSHHVIIPSIGTVEASAKTTLSAKVSGRIIQTSPAFIPGGIVKKGEILAQVDKNDYEFALAQTKAQLDSAKASEWLKANSVDTVMGKKAWDSKGDLKVSDYVVYQWDKDGKYHQLEQQK